MVLQHYINDGCMTTKRSFHQGWIANLRGRTKSYHRATLRLNHRILTSVCNSISAPCSSNKITTAAWPSLAALANAEYLSYDKVHREVNFACFGRHNAHDSWDMANPERMRGLRVLTTSSCKSTCAPNSRSMSTIALWPFSAAIVRADKPI